jgi:hypothetical protein
LLLKTISQQFQQSILSVSSDQTTDPLDNPTEPVEEQPQIHPRLLTHKRNHVQTAVITAGPPITFPQSPKEEQEMPPPTRRPADPKTAVPWGRLLKSRRLGDIDQMKQDLLAEELKNAKKVGAFLDEAVTFMKRLNQPNDLGEKIASLLNGR